MVTMPVVSAACTMLPASTWPKAGLTRNRRPNRRVVELRLRVVDDRLVALDLRRQLIDGRLLGVELLKQDRILLGEFGVALQIELPGIPAARLVLRFLRQRLVERRLIRAWIDLREDVALLDHLALSEGDF